MSVWSGRFQYLDGSCAPVNQGPCQFTFDSETAIVTPAGSTPIAFDLGDVDGTVPGEWDLQLALYTGHTVVLKQFGASFSDMTRELLAAWRDRTVRCLLLEDLEEIERFNGTANGTPAEIRVLKSNIAVIPQSGPPVQWRLAEIESLRFDDRSYSIVLESAGRKLVLGKLAKRTDEAMGRLCSAVDALHTQSAQALHEVFPFLSAPALRRLQTAMPEGCSASLRDMAEIDSRIPDALTSRAVDEHLRPYFDLLRDRAKERPLFAGFKFIRPDEEESVEISDGYEGRTPLFFWFFFPLPGGVTAWEATTGTGRATYFFRSGENFADSIRDLTRGLALINFRREPVYLPGSSLEQQPRYYRYAVGSRKLPDLRSLRAAYLGRAAHSTVEEWSATVARLVPIAR